MRDAEADGPGREQPTPGTAPGATLRSAGSPLPDAARRDNLKLWDTWTRLHEASAFYDVAGFKAGATSLFPLELEELGPSIHEGTRLLHLQCHFGLDTLSWARLGAEVVGVDLSGEAIGLARRLTDEVGLSGRAEFICADVYDADAHLGDRRFDVVFVSWGAIEWLPDLRPWARLIARRLEPGGLFYLAEIHPFASCFEEIPGEQAIRIGYDYFAGPDKPSVDPVERSYADPHTRLDGLVAWGWEHSLSEIVGSLLAAGLRLEHLHEFPFAPAPFWDWMVQDERRWWWLPDGQGGHRGDLPFSFSLSARAPAR